MRLPRHQSVPAFLTAAVLLVTAGIIPSAAQAPAPAVQAGRALGVDTASFDRTVRPQPPPVPDTVSVRRWSLPKGFVP